MHFCSITKSMKIGRILQKNLTLAALYHMKIIPESQVVFQNQDKIQRGVNNRDAQERIKEKGEWEPISYIE